MNTLVFERGGVRRLFDFTSFPTNSRGVSKNEQQRRDGGIKVGLPEALPVQSKLWKQTPSIQSSITVGADR